MARSLVLALPLIAVLAAPAAAQRLAKTALVWPKSGERARIAYVGSLASELDIGAHSGRFEKWKAQLSGEKISIATLGRPHDMLVDSRGRFWVTDMGWRRIFLFDARGRTVRVLEGGDLPVVAPMGIATDGRGTIYVADAGAHHVTLFSEASAAPIRTLGEGQLLNPVDVVVDGPRGRVYVVDSFQHQVLVFTPDGRLVQRIGRHEVTETRIVQQAAERIDNGPRGHGMSRMQEAEHVQPTGGSDIKENRGLDDGEFRYPSFAAVAPNGDLYVTDAINFRVQLFDATGKYLRTIGKPGDTPGTFARPKGVDVDSHGNVYVVDAAFNNVQIFDATGALLLMFPDDAKAKDASSDRRAASLFIPEGIFIDGRDRIFVADKYGARIQIYQLKQ